MKTIRFLSFLVLCLMIAALPGLAQTAEGDQGITINIPQIKVDIPGVGVTTTAGGMQIMENHLTKTIECNNEPVNIMGNHNNLTIKGTCTGVQVLGNHNTITIDTTPNLEVGGNHNTVTATTVDAIALMGNYNNLTWTKGTEKDPTISNLGNKNNIAKAAQ